MEYSNKIRTILSDQNIPLRVNNTHRYHEVLLTETNIEQQEFLNFLLKFLLV